MRTSKWFLSQVLASLVLALVPASSAEAGPELICRPFDAGTAPQLAWGRGPGWNTPDPTYDAGRLTADMLRLLSADAPILARMENMRRATIYATKNPRAAADLLAALLDRTTRAPHDPLAWFDAGYLIESYRQASGYARRDMVADAARDGYALVSRAIALAGSNPAMEFAASLMTPHRGS